MSYQTLLPSKLQDAGPSSVQRSGGLPSSRDSRDGSVYVLDAELRLAVDVALATGRPLLLRGEPGSGKSSLAAYIARNLKWRYYEHVVTARTSATDLLWRFDSIRKLSDASSLRDGDKDLVDFDYVDPGVLWWALDRASAQHRGGGELSSRPAIEPNADINSTRTGHGSVVLIDEVDKADPDMPNGLLVPLGSGEFAIAETGTVVRAALSASKRGVSNLFVVLTTNEERDLPPAFLRRCVNYRLEAPNVGTLQTIGRRHWAASPYLKGHVDESLLADLAVAVSELRGLAAEASSRGPSTAEYLDALWACATLGVRPGDSNWESVSKLLLKKSPGIQDSW